jgi:hypothetical protein
MSADPGYGARPLPRVAAELGTQDEEAYLWTVAGQRASYGPPPTVLPMEI